MNPLLSIARIYIPAFIKKRKLNELFAMTAEAFHSDPPEIQNLSCPDCLRAYALFSKAKAGEIIRSHKDTEAVKKRLYQNAFQLGKKLRKQFRIHTQTDVIRFSEILYSILKIKFTGGVSGEVVIEHCFFSSFYTSEICAIMSSLDAGIAAGLSDGGRLAFHARITEGDKCCRATLTMGAQSS
jgi:hypothetical protein